MIICYEAPPVVKPHVNKQKLKPFIIMGKVPDDLGGSHARNSS